MAGGDGPPFGRVSGSGLSRAWVVFEPPPPPATESVGPGIGIQVRIECLLSCDQGWYHTVRVPFGIYTIQYSGVLYGIA